MKCGIIFSVVRHFPEQIFPQLSSARRSKSLSTDPFDLRVSGKDLIKSTSPFAFITIQHFYQSTSGLVVLDVMGISCSNSCCNNELLIQETTSTSRD